MAGTVTAPLAAPASADVIATRELAAGPVDRGTVAITSVTCRRTHAQGDVGQLTIGGEVLVPPVQAGT